MMSGFFQWFRSLFVATPSGVPKATPPKPSLPAKAPTWHDVPTLSDGMRDLEWMYERMQLRHDWLGLINRQSALIRRGRDRYIKVQERTGVPWMVVGVIHSLESGCNFATHLHNGDPLSAKTVRVPAGRPAQGTPPYWWEESAVDAIYLKRWQIHKGWSVMETLDRLEHYNGLGYRKYHPTVATPYLWSGTTYYEAGKYVADGKWSATAASKQVGAAPLLQALNFIGFSR